MNPPANVWTQRADDVLGLLYANAEAYKELKANSVEWPIEQTRAAEAAARIFWPVRNTKLNRCLPPIKAPTLLIPGDGDRVMSRYADRIAKAISGGAKITTIANVGHLVELDQPDAVAKAVLDHVG